MLFRSVGDQTNIFISSNLKHHNPQYLDVNTVGGFRTDCGKIWADRGLTLNGTAPSLRSLIDLQNPDGTQINGWRDTGHGRTKQLYAK